MNTRGVERSVVSRRLAKINPIIHFDVYIRIRSLVRVPLPHSREIRCNVACMTNNDLRTMLITRVARKTRKIELASRIDGTTLIPSTSQLISRHARIFCEYFKIKLNAHRARARFSQTEGIDCRRVLRHDGQVHRFDNRWIVKSRSRTPSPFIKISRVRALSHVV